MEDPQDAEIHMGDEDYDEEADSDFDAASAQSRDSETSSDDEADTDTQAKNRSKKRRKVEPTAPKDEPIELDSGDEATIKEDKKARRRRQKKGEDVEDRNETEPDGWRARTRAMREKDQEERKQNKLASIQGSTLDVDKLWEEMNRPGPPLPVSTDVEHSDEPQPKTAEAGAANKENTATYDPEMITIKRTYKFAGEVHTEEKLVPRDSAEAKLWLAQQSNKTPSLDAEGKVIDRPLRKISRFDPNYTNLDAFRGNWAAQKKASTGPKLNVVEKSKMDWAVHVDAEGLQEELHEHAKAKDSYLSRDDFLRSVSHRKDEAAREARLRGK